MLINKDTTLCMSLAARPGNFGTFFHNYLYQKLGLNFIYKSFTTQNIGDAVAGIRALGIRGAAISMPFKEVCIPHLNELDRSAQTIGSVNTIVNTSGFLKGYNTDYIAIEQLLGKHGVDPSLRFALRGNGGMARAVLAALANNGYRNGVLVVRSLDKGKALAHEYGYTTQLDSEPVIADVLINATSVGMQGGEGADELSFRFNEIEQAKIVFDVVAIPRETPLIKKAMELGKAVISGTDVAVIQSLEQFVLYTGVRPSLDEIQEAQLFTNQQIRLLEAKV
ncbi:shikimate 5-dehydrogenase [Bacteroides propionicifaciens]|uniref:shikimate 5-dehydrogenase n=1 Tax=Bacteroides propionicifaciens TaxID=392838 RepID=UPI0003A442A5|nr:shikimate 5-dehydrogenase [Bacteroides propionicifaciens]